MRILIAEDNLEESRAIVVAFQESGIDASGIQIVTSSQELISILRGRAASGLAGGLPQPDIILLDLRMSGMDGYEVLKVIKGDPALRQIPVMAFGGLTSEDEIGRVYDLGVNAFIQKPEDPDGLSRVVSAVKVFWTGVARLPSR